MAVVDAITRQGPFDPYYEWLQIDPSEQPPTLYKLLGLSDAFVRRTIGLQELPEEDLRAIQNAADQRMAHLRTFQTGRNSAECQRLLNEVSRARITLLSNQKRLAYNATLGQAVEIRGGDIRHKVFQTSPEVMPGYQGMPQQIPAVPMGPKPGNGGKGPAKRPQPRATAGRPPIPPPPPAAALNGNGGATVPIISAPRQEAPLSFLDDQLPARSNPRSNGRHTKERGKESFFQRKPVQVVGAIGAGVIAMSAGVYALFAARGGGAESKENRPVAKRQVPPDELKTLPIAQQPTIPDESIALPPQPLPKEETPAPPEPPKPDPVQPPPPEVAMNTNPVAPVIGPDPEAEAKKRLEEETQRKTEELRGRYARLSSKQLTELIGEGPSDPAVRAAQERILLEKQTAEQEGNAFIAKVTSLHATMRTKYQTVKTAEILAAVKGEPDAAARTAMLAIVVGRAAEKGDAVTIDRAMQMMDDPHLTPHWKVRFKASAFATHKDASLAAIPPTSRMAVARQLLRDVQAAYAADDYDLAARVLETARAYLKGIRYSDFDARERTQQMQTLRELNQLITAEQHRMTELADQHAQFQTGLDATMQPKDAAAAFEAGVYVVTVRGGWAEGIRYLSGCNNPHVQKAAQLDQTGPKNAQEMYDCAQAWMAAGAVAQHPELWYQRAAYWLAQAQAQNPTGKLKLDIGASLGGLGAKGIEPDGKTGGEGWVAGNKEQTGTQQSAEVFPKGKWVDVMQFIDVKKHTRKGAWGIGTAGLTAETTGGYNGMLIDIPLKISGSYELEVEVQKHGVAGVNLGIPVGNSKTEVVIAEDKIGIGPIDGKRYSENGSTADFRQRLPEVYKVQIRVNDLGNGNWLVIVGVNGRAITQFQGHESRLSYPEGWGGEMPFVGAWRPNGGNVHYRSIKIRLINGKVSAVSE